MSEDYAKKGDVDVLHTRISQFKNRIWGVTLAFVLPLLGFLGAGAWWAFNVGAQAKANGEAIEGKASKEETRAIRDHQIQQNGAINWIAAAIEQIAEENGVSLPRRPIIPPTREHPE